MHLEIKQATDKIEIVSALVIDKLYQLAFEDQATGVVSLLDVTSDVQGHIQAPAAYEDAVKYLVGIEVGDVKRFPNLYIDIPNQNYFIRFKDPVVELYCVLNYGSGGGVTKNIAAGVINNFWGLPAANNGMSSDLKSQVTTLDDALYFTSITTKKGINDFLNATSITFGNTTYYNSLSSPDYFVGNCPNLETINFLNALFVYTGTNLYGWDIINYNNTIADWSDSLVPRLTDLYRIGLFNTWRKLTKIIYREGITRINSRSRSNNSLQYIEFPSTITDIGYAYEWGRDNGHDIPAMVIKATTPPIWNGWNSSNTGGSGHGFGWDRFPSAIYVPDSAVTAYTSVAATGDTADSAWASPYIQDKIRPLSTLPQIYLEMGTVTQEDIDRV